MLSLTGKGPTDRFVGDYLGISNIEGPAGTRLYAWWFEASKADWSLRAGALLADEEFAGTAAGGNLLNSAFGWPAFISANTLDTGPAFYAAAPGARLEYRLTENVTWKVGVFDGDTYDSCNGSPQLDAYGWRYRLGGGQGLFAIGEVGYAPANGTGRLKVGCWLHTARFDDMRRDNAGRFFADSGAAPLRHHGNGGAYVAFEASLAGESGKPGEIETFLRGGISPSDRNALGWAIDAGLAWTGPLPCRPADVAALGITHAEFGGPFAANAVSVNPGQAKPDFERVIEVNYRINISERFDLIPDLQYLCHPGGSAARSDALIATLRWSASF